MRQLGKMADGVFLVVRPGVVDADSGTFSKRVFGAHVKCSWSGAQWVMPENEPYSYYHYAKEYSTEESANIAEKSSHR